jgi:hypothetical protein
VRSPPDLLVRAYDRRTGDLVLNLGSNHGYADLHVDTDICGRAFMTADHSLADHPADAETGLQVSWHCNPEAKRVGIFPQMLELTEFANHLAEPPRAFTA